MTQWILQTIASLLLGFVALCALLLLYSAFLLSAIFEDDIYAEALAEHRAYSRVYSEVLTPHLVTASQGKHIPEFALLTPEDSVDLIRETAPPQYLQQQVEANLGRLSTYLKGDSSQLSLYLDFTDPLERLPVALADRFESRASQAPALLVRQTNPLLSELTGQEIAADIASDLEALLAGGNPSRTLAEYTGRNREELIAIVDNALDDILANPELPAAYRGALSEARPELGSSFAHGNTRDLLELAINVLAQPVLDEILESSEAELDERNRLNLIPLLAQHGFGVSEPTFLRILGDRKDTARTSVFWGKVTALGMLLSVVGLLALVNWGRPRLLVLWTGWILAVSGGLLLTATILSIWQLPGIIEQVTQQWLVGEFPSQPGLASLSVDVAGQVVRNLLNAAVWPAAIPLAAGCLLLASLTVWERRKISWQEARAVEAAD